MKRFYITFVKPHSDLEGITCQSWKADRFRQYTPGVAQNLFPTCKIGRKKKMRVTNSKSVSDTPTTAELKIKKKLS